MTEDPAAARTAAQDTACVARVLDGGETEAFAELVDAHQSAVRGWLRRLVNDADAADDLAQDTFVRAFERLGSWRGGSFRAWLFTIARNLAFESFRRSERERRAVDGLALFTDDRSTPMPEVHDLEGLLARLGAVERECLVLALGWGLTNAEIGAILELPVGTVKSHVHRARRRLGPILEEAC